MIEHPRVRQDGELARLVGREKMLRNLRRTDLALLGIIAIPGGWPLTIPIAVGLPFIAVALNVGERYYRSRQRSEAALLSGRGQNTPLVQLVQRREAKFFNDALPRSMIREANNVRREFRRVS